MRRYSEEKPYMCNQCDMSFSQNSNLITHIRTHAGDKPYQCAEFQNHMRIHTGTMQDQCSNCGKTFSCPYSINYLQTHTGKKSHLCSNCEKYFSVIQPALHMQNQDEPITFKGIKLVNPPGENLFYINATVNAFFKM